MTINGRRFRIVVDLNRHPHDCHRPHIDPLWLLALAVGCLAAVLH